MYNGVKAMIDAEKELRPAPKAPKVEEAKPAEKKEEAKPAEKKEEAPKAGEKSEERTKCGTHLKKPEDIKGYPEFPADCKSLLCKHLTPEVWA